MRSGSVWRRWLVRSLLVLLLFFIAALAGGVFYLRSRISPEKISADVSEILRKRFGFALSIAELRFTWTGDAELKKICVRNPRLISQRCLFEADIVRLDLKLLPLLKKNIEIRGAHLDAAALNLFTESQPVTGQKPVLLKSWEAEAITTSAATGGESGRSLKLEKLKITQGSINHEAAVLPLPQGQTRYQLEMRDAGKKLSLSAELPDMSRAKAELQLNVANLLATARAIASGPKLAAGDNLTGTVDCERCNLAPLDARAGILNGALQLQLTENSARVSAQNVQLTTRSPYAPNLSWTGFIALRLPELLPEAGEGSLTAPGLNLRYAELSGSAKTGPELSFEAAADLARMPAFAARGVQLGLYAKGKLRANFISAYFQGKNLSYRIGNTGISAEAFSGTVAGHRLAIAQQHFAIAQNQAEVTLTADLTAGRARIAGSVSFAQLNLDAFSSGNAGAAQAAGTPTAPAAGGIEASLRVSARQLTYGKLKAENFSAELATDGSSAQLKQLQFVLGRGRVSGNYRRAATGLQNVALSIAGVKAQDLSPLLGFKATIYGDMNADARLEFSGSSSEAVLKSATGAVNLRIGRGKIRDSFLQKGVLGGPLHKLEEKFSDIEFASALAEVKLNSGNITVQKLFFDAEEWNVTYRAEANSDWQGKAALNFRFRSSFVENVANPLHMGISERKDGVFYDLPFACRGQILTGSCYVKNW